MPQPPDSNTDGHLATDTMATPSANGAKAGGVASIVPAIREQAGKLAESSKTAGVETTDALGKAVESAANVLQDTVSALAGYVRSAATYTNKLADSLRDEKAEDLIASAVSWGRKQPLMVVAGAALLGFTLARLVKSGVVEQVPAAAVEAKSTEAMAGGADGTT
jgi:hypothetical protein